MKEQNFNQTLTICKQRHKFQLSQRGNLSARDIPISFTGLPGYEVEDTRENFNFPSAVNNVTNQIWQPTPCRPTRQKPAQSKALTLQDECKVN